MFFAKNLGRVGIDFRGLLTPIFEKCILSIFERSMNRSITQFSTHLRKYKNLSAHKGLSQYNPTTESSAEFPAPRILLDYPPLAILTNSILETFNDLRTCWPYSLKISLAELLKQSLFRVLEKLREHKTLSHMSETEIKLFGEMCQVVAEEFLPYISNCFDAIFQSVSQKLISLDQLQNRISDLYEVKISQETLEEMLKSKESDEPPPE